MAVVRVGLAREGRFTLFPNEFARDKRLSNGARGLLVQIMSHAEGWELTTETLANSTREGRDAIRSQVRLLEQCGYLTRVQKHSDDGTFARMDYLLTDPFEAADPQDVNDPTGDGFSGDGFPGVGFPGDGKLHTKKTIDLEDHLEEDHVTPQPPARHSQTPLADVPDVPRPTSGAGRRGSAVVERSSGYPPEFEEFWQVYPRRTAKRAALGAWKKAARRASVAEIMAGAERFRDDPNREQEFTPHPATWLNQDRWGDDPLPERRSHLTASERRAGNTRSFLERVIAEEEGEQPWRHLEA